MYLFWTYLEHPTGAHYMMTLAKKKLFLTSKFSYLNLLQPHPSNQKLKTERTANMWELLTAKPPPRRIIMIDQSENRERQSVFITLFSSRCRSFAELLYQPSFQQPEQTRHRTKTNFLSQTRGICSLFLHWILMCSIITYRAPLVGKYSFWEIYIIFQYIILFWEIFNLGRHEIFKRVEKYGQFI